MNFKDMRAAIAQHQQGLLADHELILNLQCSLHQVRALILMSRMPLKIFNQVTLEDFDESIADQEEKDRFGNPVLSLSVDRQYYQVRSNAAFKDAAAEALKIVARDKSIIHFEFNGRLVTVTQADTADSLFAQHIALV